MTSQLKSPFVRISTAFAAASVLASASFADIIGPGFRVTATTSSGATSTLEFPVTFHRDGTASWEMTDQYEMYDYSVTPPRVIATLNPVGAASRLCAASY